MSKAVLISIQPKWCEKIARGEKKIEVRKNRPKLETPFKCYIYCTANGITAAERNRNIFTDLSRDTTALKTGTGMDVFGAWNTVTECTRTISAPAENGGQTMADMICPYNGFKKCDWDNCAARMWTTDRHRGSHSIMKVCAIAYIGGAAPHPVKDGDNNAKAD